MLEIMGNKIEKKLTPKEIEKLKKEKLKKLDSDNIVLKEKS